MSGSLFGGTRELPSKKQPLHKKREQRTMNKERSTQKRTRNAERRMQPAQWRGWPAGQLDSLKSTPRASAVQKSSVQF